MYHSPCSLKGRCQSIRHVYTGQLTNVMNWLHPGWFLSKELVSTNSFAVANPFSFSLCLSAQPTYECNDAEKDESDNQQYYCDQSDQIECNSSLVEVRLHFNCKKICPLYGGTIRCEGSDDN